MPLRPCQANISKYYLAVYEKFLLLITRSKNIYKKKEANKCNFRLVAQQDYHLLSRQARDRVQQSNLLPESPTSKNNFQTPSFWSVLVDPSLCSEFKEMLILKVTISLINLTVSKKRTALHMVAAPNSVWYFSGGPQKLASEQVPTCLRVNRK